MDRPFVKYPLLFGALGIIIKMVIFFYGLQHQPVDQYYRLALPLFLLLAVFFGVKHQKKEEGEESSRTFVDDVKTGIKSGMIFTVLIALFSFLYYSVIDPDYHESRTQAIIEKYKQQQKAAEKGEAQEPMGGKKPEEIRENLETWTDPFNIMTLNLLAFTALSIVDALLVVLFDRKLLRRMGY